MAPGVHSCVGPDSTEPVAAFNQPFVQVLISITVAVAYSIAPLSLFRTCYVLMFGLKETASFFEVSCTGWAFVETAFLFHFLRRLASWQQPASWKHLPTRCERILCWKRMLATMPGGPAQFLSSWFRTPFSELTVGDRDLLFQLVINPGEQARLRSTYIPKPVAPVDNGDDLSIEANIWVEVDMMTELAVASDPEISRMVEGPPVHQQSLMAFMQDGFFCWPVAFIIYLTNASLQALFSLSYLMRGYRRSVAGQLVYWFRPGVTSSDSPPPIVFFPGVGTGIFMYDMFLQLIEQKDASRAIFLVEIPQVSMNLSNWAVGNDAPPAWDKIVDSVHEMISRESNFPHQKVVLVAHSYGTLLLSRVLKKLPSIVHGAVLYEPACCLCHYPKMLKDFVYSLGTPFSPLGALFRLEPHVSLTLRRHFDFNKIMLFFDEVNHRFMQIAFFH